MKADKGKMSFILSMVIFGSIGLFRRYIDMPSSFIACVRGVLGAVSILLLMFSVGQKPDINEIKKSAVPLIVSGVFIGINWILLFEAYNYTTVAAATLCYYMQPVIVVLLSAPLLSEKLTAKKCLCVLAALTGMFLVSGILNDAGAGSDSVKGALLGLGAAVFYAFVVLINKKWLTETKPMETTVTQIFTAGAFLIPYVFSKGAISAVNFSVSGILMLIFVALVHTGLAYWLFFKSVKKIPAQTAAILSYIDPVVAVLVSAVFLKEPLTPAGIAGAVLIIAAAFISEK